MTKCVCSGPICSCGAYGVVKDGAGVRVPAHLMDNANGQLIVDGVTIDRATFDSYMVSAEHAYDQGMHDSAHQYLGDKAPPFDDAAACRALANRIGQNQRIAQNTERLREIAANPTAYSKDGRLVADLTPSERARHDMMRDDMMRAYASGGK